MKSYILLLLLFVANVALSQSDKLLVVKNSKSQREVYFKEGEIIKVWTEESHYKGKLEIIDNVSIKVGGDKLNLEEIITFKGTHNYNKIIGSVVAGVPSGFTMVIAILAITGDIELGGVIVGVGGFFVSLVAVPVGLYVALSKKKHIDSKQYSIKIK